MPFTPFFHSLSLDPLATMEELYKLVDRYSTLEDNICAATQTVIITSKLAGSSKPMGKKPSELREKIGSDPEIGYRTRGSPHNSLP